MTIDWFAIPPADPALIGLVFVVGLLVVLMIGNVFLSVKDHEK